LENAASDPDPNSVSDPGPDSGYGAQIQNMDNPQNLVETSMSKDKPMIQLS